MSLVDYAKTERHREAMQVWEECGLFREKVLLMDYQVFFNIGIALVGFAFGWMVNRVFVLLDRIDADMRNIPLQYVTKEDYRADIAEIKEMLGAIFKRLENKADK
jgi:hypothetical protein|tara:strand:+ start:807 stop:1121 length:315 start_codon:yes stop_codon:yes gene_type:complete